MWQCCQFWRYFNNHIRLIYQIYSYSNYLEHNQDHDVLYLDQICETIQSCGSVAIKFCQWVTPKLELMHTEENDLVDKERVKPLWLQKLETFYENCNEHSTEYTIGEYNRVFHEDFHNHYEILNTIGSGSIGQVYLIQNKPLKEYTERKKYVMKVIHPNVIYEINFFRTFYKLITWIPCLNNRIKQILPFEVCAFIDQFEQQSNFIMESSNLLTFYEAYKDNHLIVIPRLIKVAETIMIMSYEEGKSFEDCKLNKYQKYKLVLLFNLFIRNNQHILNCNHGDLHKGNWKVRISDDNDHKLVIYDFGFCWKVPHEKHYLIELTYDTFESADKDVHVIDNKNITELLLAFVIYEREDKELFKQRARTFADERIEKLEMWMFSPIKLFKFVIELCLQENIRIDPIMIQTIIVAIQCQLMSQEYGLKASSTQEIGSYEIYRSRYVDMLTFCKTKNIFQDYRVSIENKLNEKQTEVKGLFDFIEMPDSIKALALAK